MGATHGLERRWTDIGRQHQAACGAACDAASHLIARVKTINQGFCALHSLSIGLDQKAVLWGKRT